MLKKTITYTDFNGNQRTEDFRFNLTKAELAEFQLSTPGGLEALINQIVAAQDLPQIIDLFKTIILKAYGEVTPDGKGFVKKRDGHKLADDFESTEAYSELFMELATNAEEAAKFINGIVPQELAQQASGKVVDMTTPELIKAAAAAQMSNN